MAPHSRHVREDGDGLWLVLPDGGREPLRSDTGRQLTGFVEDWSVTDLDLGHAPLRLLNFAGPAGTRAVWILDRGNRRLGDSFATVGTEARTLLRRSVTAAFRTVLDGICAWPEENPMAAVASLDRLDPVLRRDVLTDALDTLLPDAVVHAAPDCPEEFLVPGSRRGNLRLRREHVLLGFAEGLQARLAAAGDQAPFSWPSPIDGRPLPCRGSVCIDDFRFLYKFVDRDADLCFFVVASDHLCRALAIFLPHAGIVLRADEPAGRLLDAFFPRGVGTWFLRHCIQHYAALDAYFRGGPKTLVSLFRGPDDIHLGHQIWNELSGIQSLMGRANAAMPRWCIPSRTRPIEAWGDVGSLFPEIADRIDRSLEGYDSLPADAYSRNWCTVRITSDYVSNGLRERLLAQPAVREASGRAKRLLASRGIGDAPIIVVGLRVENRTVVELDRFCTELAEFIAGGWPGAVLVFDGHNTHADAAPGRSHIRSHGEAEAARLVEVETELVAKVRARMAQRPIEILDTVGRPLGDSIAWGTLADCFVAIWGAGLAKLCWACRKPGVIITSRANLESRDDLHIYDSPRYLEDPAPVRFVHPQWVIDRPDAEQLVPVAPGNPFFCNFWIGSHPLHDVVGEVVSAALQARNGVPPAAAATSARSAPKARTGKAGRSPRTGGASSGTDDGTAAAGAFRGRRGS